MIESRRSWGGKNVEDISRSRFYPVFAMQKRPWGVTFVSSLMIVVGGFSTIIIFIFILDSVRVHGLSSLLITTPLAFLGFILYGIMPLLFYSAGVSLYMARPWARRVTMTVVPLAGLSLFLNWKYRFLLAQSMLLNPSVFDVVREQPTYFLQAFLQPLVIWLLLISYFCKPHVKSYFSSAPAYPNPSVDT